MNTIHPTATVAPTAVIGAGSEIGPYSIIADGVVIGAETVIESHVRVQEGTRIGNRCRLRHGVCIGGLPQSIAFDIGIPTTVEIGDENTFGEFCTVHRATTESYTTRIGSRCRIHAYAHVPHDAQIGNDVTLENFVQLAGHTHIGDHTVIRGGTAIHQFTHIGSFCDIGATISKDVPPFLRYERFRLSSDHRLAVNEAVLRGHGHTDADLETIRALYRILYDSGLNVTKAVEEIGGRMPDSELATTLTSFIGRSKRGLVAGRIR